MEKMNRRKPYYDPPQGQKSSSHQLAEFVALQAISLAFSAHLVTTR